MEFIDSSSIFNDNSVIHLFHNSGTPIIRYNYNKPIRYTIFNFNKVVIDINIDSNTPDF